MKQFVLAMVLVLAGCEGNASEVTEVSSSVSTYDMYRPASWGNDAVAVWAGDLYDATNAPMVVMKNVQANGHAGECSVLQIGSSSALSVAVVVHGSPGSDTFTVGSGTANCSSVIGIGGGPFSYKMNWFHEPNVTAAPPTMKGEGGNDTLSSGGPGIILDGGDGNDFFYVYGGDGPTSTYGGAGNDKILMIGTSSGQIINSGDGDDCVWTEFYAPPYYVAPAQLTCGAGTDKDGWVPNPPPSPWGISATTGCENHTAPYRCGL